MDETDSIVCVYIFFIHSSDAGHLDWFHKQTTFLSPAQIEKPGLFTTYE